MSWIKTDIIVDRYPTPQEIEKSNFDYIINVSDEYIEGCALLAAESNIRYFWFPMNENVGEIGLNSIFAAMQILWIAEQEEAKVLIHCHAGANRSQLIMDCYWFMRTGEHRPVKKIPQKINEELNVWLGLPKDHVNNKNLLETNCELEHLPPIENMERFLAAMPEQFNKIVADKGGAIDICKLKMIDDGEEEST